MVSPCPTECAHCVIKYFTRDIPLPLVRLMKFRPTAHWNWEDDDHDLQQNPSAHVISEPSLHGLLRKRQREADKKEFEPFRWFILFALSAVKNTQTQVSTTGKCFLNVMAAAPLIGLRSICTQLCPAAYEIYISKKAAHYFGLVIRPLSVNKTVSFQLAGNSKEIGFFFHFSQWCTHSKANVNMRLTSLRWETDPVRWTQTCASKYRRLGRAFASDQIIASMNKHGDSVYPLLDVTVGSLTRWRETFVFKPQGTTPIYVAAKGSVKSLTNILKKHVFLPPLPLCGTCSTFPTFVLLAVSSQIQNGTPSLKSQTDWELCAFAF